MDYDWLENSKWLLIIHRKRGSASSAGGTAESFSKLTFLDIVNEFSACYLGFE